jgi:hypothetical protein
MRQIKVYSKLPLLQYVAAATYTQQGNHLLSLGI